MYHFSVLRDEVINYLEVKAGKNYVDATVGNGGHLLEILKRNGPNGKIAAIDWNEETLKIAKKRIEKEIGSQELKRRVFFINDNFKNIRKAKNFLDSDISGIIADLGISSWILEESGGGFSFKIDELIDMRFNKNEGIPVYEYLNSLSETKLKEIFETFGEEKKASLIAKQIIKARQKDQILTTFDLKKIIQEVYKNKRILNKVNSRIFQALRIYANDELRNLEDLLENSFEILSKNGNLVIISFHSLEDRIVKNFFKNKKERKEALILTKKPIVPSSRELEKNKKSRSAKLRAIKKI